MAPLGIMGSAALEQVLPGPRPGRPLGWHCTGWGRQDETIDRQACLDSAQGQHGTLALTQQYDRGFAVRPDDNPQQGLYRRNIGIKGSDMNSVPWRALATRTTFRRPIQNPDGIAAKCQFRCGLNQASAHSPVSGRIRMVARGARQVEATPYLCGGLSPTCR